MAKLQVTKLYNVDCTSLKWKDNYEIDYSVGNDRVMILRNGNYYTSYSNWRKEDEKQIIKDYS